MRAFLAVHLDEGLRKDIGALQNQLRQILASAGGRVRATWVKPEVIHLTVKFLGDIPEEDARSLRDRIDPIVTGHLALDVPLEQLGAFPRPQAPRTIWLGPGSSWHETSEARSLHSLVRRIDAACASVGVPAEPHDWRPHLTLARIRDGERIAGKALVASGEFDLARRLPPITVRAISLMRSELGPEGPQHTEVWVVS